MVIKIGTNTLTDPKGGVDQSFLNDMARQVNQLRNRGLEVLLVSSGAIGVGTAAMGRRKKVSRVNYRQAFAAIGQPLLMHQYNDAFKSFQIPLAQVLVTREIFNQRESYLNVRNTVETLLKMGALPIFNENDSVSTREIGPVFGDNDSLSAHIASKLDADLLIILSDIDGLYDENPTKNPQAKRLTTVEKITPEIEAMAGGSGSEFSTGGMVTKLKAVDIASPAGCALLLAHGRDDDILIKLIEGNEEGTLFLAGPRENSRSRWIRNAQSKGCIQVDRGALQALKNHKSLLPSGVVSVTGDFQSGDVVDINSHFKGVTNLSSNEIRQVLGKHSSQIQEILGAHKRDDIARPEDIVEI